MPGRHDEDRYSVYMHNQKNEMVAFGLFDGFTGQTGADICSSEFCRRVVDLFHAMSFNLRNKLGLSADDELSGDANDALICEAIYKVCKAVDREIKKVDDSGTTLTGLFIRKLRDGSFKVYCCNAGNARCILKKDGCVLALTEDHNLNLRRELERIEKRVQIEWNPLPAVPIRLLNDFHSSLPNKQAFQYPPSDRMAEASELVKSISALQTDKMPGASSTASDGGHRITSDDTGSCVTQDRRKEAMLLRESVSSLAKKAFKLLSVASVSFYVVEHSASITESKGLMQFKISSADLDLGSYSSIEQRSLRECMTTGQPVLSLVENAQQHVGSEECVAQSSDNAVASTDDVSLSIAEGSCPMQCVSIPVECAKLNVLIGVLVLLCPKPLQEREVSLLTSMCGRASEAISDALAQCTVPRSDNGSTGVADENGSSVGFDGAPGQGDGDEDGQSVGSDVSKDFSQSSNAMRPPMARQESFIVSRAKNGGQVLSLCGRYEFSTTLTRSLGSRFGPRSSSWVPEITATVIQPGEHAR